MQRSCEKSSMPSWNRTLILALICFVIASTLSAAAFFLHQRETNEHIGVSIPLPPPGRGASWFFRPADNWRHYQLTLSVSVEPTNSVAMPKFSTLPCDLLVSFSRGDRVDGVHKLRMHQIGTVEWVPEALFGTEVFEFSPGDRDVKVTNLGCDKGYPFIGGVLSMERVSPVMFSSSTLPFLGAILFTLLGLIATLVGSISCRLSRVTP